MRETETDADIAIHPDRPTLVRGRSGSGKSPLLRMLNRMTPPSAGSVIYRGRELAGIPPVEVRRRVVMLSQTPVLFGGSVREEATAGRRFASLPEVDDGTIRRAVFGCIRDWCGDGRSVIAATHSPFTSMLGEADRLVFRNGRLEKEADE